MSKYTKILIGIFTLLLMSACASDDGENQGITCQNTSLIGVYGHESTPEWNIEVTNDCKIVDFVYTVNYCSQEIGFTLPDSDNNTSVFQVTGVKGATPCPDEGEHLCTITQDEPELYIDCGIAFRHTFRRDFYLMGI